MMSLVNQMLLMGKRKKEKRNEREQEEKSLREGYKEKK